MMLSSSAESLSQLRVQICSIRLPSSTKSVDIVVHMEVDEKYPFRTEIIRRRNRTTPTTSIIPINESFDVLVTSNSKIKIKILAPTRLFGAQDLGQLQFTIKSILESYQQSRSSSSSEQTDHDTIPSYTMKMPFENSTTASSSLFRSNDVNNNSSYGLIEIIFYGSLLKQQNNHPQTVRKRNLTLSVSLFSFHFHR